MAWRTCSLGDVCEVIAGQSPDGSYYNDCGEGLPFYQGKKEFGERDIGAPRVWTTLVTKQGEAGDILMSVRAPVGPINYAIERCCIGRGLAALRAKPALDQEFLFYMLLAKQPEIAGSEGAVFPSISKTQIEAIKVVVPPLPEQKRIVAILDEAFEGIRIATAHAEKNLANARELDIALIGGFLRDLPTEGQTTLGDEADIFVGFAFKSKQYTDAPGSVALLRGDNIVQGALRWEDAKRWPEDDVQPYADYLLQANDTVIAMDRTWVKAGVKFAQVAGQDLPCLLVQRVARLRCQSRLDPRFLFHVLRSRQFERYVVSIQGGLGVPHISGSQIASFAFAKPDRAEQRRVADILDAASASLDTKTQAYQRRLADLERVKQSILSRAFSGQLTATKGLAA